MKATVTTPRGISDGVRSVEVEISAYSEMTPQAALAFARVAFGNTRGPYTIRGDGKTYRVTNGKARKTA